MSISFSETTNNTGIVQQTRDMLRVDSTQYPTSRIVNSCNNWLDTVTGYAIGADSRFQWDDTNHTALPEGTTNVVANQSDYSFLTDQQGNTILTIIRLEMLDSNGNYSLLHPIDQAEFDYDSLNQMQATASTPQYYDKIADNIIRLYPKPSTSVTAGLKFSFQRSPSYFAATDTTKAPGVAPVLHRGFIVASVYDALLAGIGSANLQAVSVEMQKEEAKMKEYYTNRNNDERNVMTMRPISFI
jgi:hypothetical protein